MPQLGLGSSLSRGGVLSAGFLNTYSLNFDGTDDKVTLTPFDPSDTDNVSLSMWIKTTSTTAGTIWDMRLDDVSGSYFFIRLNDGEDDRLAVYVGGYKYKTSSGLNDGGWHNLIITVEPSSGNSKLHGYIDGGSDIYNVTTAAPLGFVSGMDTMNIMPGTTTSLIDEVALWGVTLNSTNATAIYNSGTPIALDGDSGNYDNSSNLIGWWRFEEGSGTSVADSSDNSNAGILVNGPSHSTDVPS